ncbi:hypothetical protein [Kitasatospora sp. MAA4]|uniref:hypothetical protein n=1 Tax=Kitasatospora sp. MAA4 TaxID=3035093 RepID=UPI002475C8C9|nr:hypothetical protein [Kitasatospora sp. MAA4]
MEGPSRARHRVEGILYRPVDDLPPSRLVLAWRRADRSPLIPAYTAAFCASLPRQIVRRLSEPAATMDP